MNPISQALRYIAVRHRTPPCLYTPHNIYKRSGKEARYVPITKISRCRERERDISMGSLILIYLSAFPFALSLSLSLPLPLSRSGRIRVPGLSDFHLWISDDIPRHVRGGERERARWPLPFTVGCTPRVCPHTSQIKL